MKKIILRIIVLLVGILNITSGLASGNSWHTSPDQWKEPRIFHSAFQNEFKDRLEIGRDVFSIIPTEQHWSPNKAYYYMILFPDTSKANCPWDTIVSIYNEKDYLVQIRIKDHSNSFPKIQWINEKLLYIEIWWGRVIGTYMIFDVEKEKTIYREMIQDGTIPYQQWNEKKKKKF